MFSSALATIPRKLPITRRSKVQDSIKFERNKKQSCDRRRRHRKRQIKFEHNKKVGRTRFGRSRTATQRFKEKKTLCCNRLVRRNSPGLRTGSARSYSTTRIRKNRSYRSSRVIWATFVARKSMSGSNWRKHSGK